MQRKLLNICGLKSLNYETEYQQNQEFFHSFLNSIAEMPSSLTTKALRKQFLRLIIFGIPKLLPRLISFCSPTLALAEINIAMQILLQKLPCLAELHTLREQWLNSFWMHNTSCVFKTCILTCIIRFLKHGRIRVLKSAKCTCIDMSVNTFAYKSEDGYEKYRNYFLIIPIIPWNFKTSI